MTKGFAQSATVKPKATYLEPQRVYGCLISKIAIGRSVPSYRVLKFSDDSFNAPPTGPPDSTAA